MIANRAIIFHSDDKETLRSLINEHDLFFITLSADTISDSKKHITKQQKILLKLPEHLPEKKFLLYTSSTSVYEEENGGILYEDSPLEERKSSAVILQKTENKFLELQKKNWNVCILRLSEIYGPERSLKARLERMEGKSFPGDGENFSNMVHVEDIARASYFAMEHRLNGIYNLSDDDHPKRRDLYEEVCNKHHLLKVQWDPNLPRFHGANKKVSSEKIKKNGFQLKMPHRVT